MNVKRPEKTAKRLKLSFQRATAAVVITKASRTVEATVGLLDVSESGAGVFTTELLHKGSMIELRISEPSPVSARGIVAWSVPMAGSGLQEGKFNCRSGIQFVFTGDAQRASVVEFVTKVGMDPIENLKAVEAANQANAIATAFTSVPESGAVAPAEVIPVQPAVAGSEALPVISESAPVAETVPVAAEAAPVVETAPVATESMPESTEIVPPVGEIAAETPLVPPIVSGEQAA